MLSEEEHGISYILKFIRFLFFASAQQVATSVKYWTIKFMKIISMVSVHCIYILVDCDITEINFYFTFVLLRTSGNDDKVT